MEAKKIEETELGNPKSPDEIPIITEVGSVAHFKELTKQNE